MPSVMDFIRFREKLFATSPMARTIFFNDIIIWLETEEINRLPNPQLVEKYRGLIELLKSANTMDKLNEEWFSKFQFTYGSLGCMEKLFRRFK